MKHFTDEDIDAFINNGKHSQPRDWFFARDFWESRTKGGELPDQGNPHYAGLNRCWGWNGRILGGYGVVHRFDKTIGAHRISYQIHHGPIPEGMFVLHKCDNKICTNPEHLELGNHRKNMRDAHQRGLVKKGKLKARSDLQQKDLFLAMIDRIAEAWDRSGYYIYFGEGEEKRHQHHLFQERLRTVVLEAFKLFKPEMLGYPSSEEVDSERVIKKRLKDRLQNTEVIFSSDTIRAWFSEQEFGGCTDTRDNPWN